MLPSKTVFVIGAGASAEADLPTGDSLRDKIAKKLNFHTTDYGHPDGGDREIYITLRNLTGDAKKRGAHIDACQLVSTGIVWARSIDDYIHQHEHVKEIAAVGKLAIASTILEAERGSKLAYDMSNINNTMDSRKLRNTWYTSFFNLLSDGVTKSGLKNLFNNVTLVIFNYDRCVEHFLVNIISNVYHIPKTEAGTLVQQLCIYRPYGIVFPYFGNPNEVIEFGSVRLPEFDNVVSSLKTYTEQIEDKTEIDAIQQAISDAKVLVFLGNAYHSRNMELLLNPTNVTGRKSIYHTRRGIKEGNMHSVRTRLTRLCNQTPDLLPADSCYDLFDEYHMALRG